MYSVELYAKARRAVMVDKYSKQETAELFGIHHNTVDMPMNRRSANTML